MQTVDVTLGLGGNSPDFKPNSALRDTSLELCNTPDTNVLEGVLQTGLKVGDKLGDGATVQDRSTIWGQISIHTTAKMLEYKTYLTP